jgi:hypothetical protein
VINERTRVGSCDIFHPRQRFDENVAGVFAGDISAGEDKCLDFCGLQGESFELAVANALIAREHNPAVLPCLGKPDFVLRTLGEVVRGVDRSTLAPASLSAVAMLELSSDSSRKKVTGSGGFEIELAADRIPDRFFACAVLLRQVRYLISRFELLGECGCRNACAR